MPRILKRLSRRSSVPPVERPGLVPMDDLPSSRRPYGSKNMVIGTEGRVSTEAGVFSQILGPEERLFSIPAIGRDSEGDEDSSEDGGEDIVGEEVGVRNEAEARKRAGKKERQWRNWSEEVIPAMLEPYMELLRKSDALRDLSSARKHQQCKGCTDGRLLEVICVYFESMFLFF
jgi:hypothetical protein